jgi:UDP-galactopyranose mutase
MKRNLPVVCFSHLRWNFVYQRPQHLLSRFARHSQVFFIEEPIKFLSSPDSDNKARIEVSQQKDSTVLVITAHIPDQMNAEEENEMVAHLIEEVLENYNVVKFHSMVLFAYVSSLYKGN